VTAGPDLSIGEFEEVGSAIKEFASEDATVVVGTVIDPELHAGELRVTVVATGLGYHAESMKPVRLVERTGASDVDYKHYDKPTMIRDKKAVGDGLHRDGGFDTEYLDIPAFLRRQAD
jgi:cell division protein FtsZ